MSLKETRREYETRSSNRTKSLSKIANSSTDIDIYSPIYDEISKNQQKKRKRYASSTDTERIQKITFVENDDRDIETNEDKRFKKSDKSRPSVNTFCSKNSNETIDSSFVCTNKNKTQTKRSDLHTSRLKDTPTNFMLHSTTKTTEKLSKNSSSKIPVISIPKLLKTSKRLASKKNNVSPKNNNSQIKLRSSDVAKSKNSFSLGMKQGLRKFSKSPKKVLKLSKLRTAHKKSSLSKQEAFDTKCCPNGNNDVTPSQLNKTKFVSTKNSVIDRTSIVSTATDNVIDIISSTKLISMKNMESLKIVLQRLSDIEGNEKNVSQKIFNSTTSCLQKTSNTSTAKHLRSNNKDESNPDVSFGLKKMNELDDTSQRLPKPLMSSTPRNEQQSNGRKNESKPGIKAIRINDSAYKLSKCKASNAREESILEAGDKQKETKGKNSTYELIEPKTPKRRKKLQKEQDEATGSKNVIKKNYGTHFTSHSSNTNCAGSLQLRTSHNKKKDIKDSGNKTIAVKLKQDILKSSTRTFSKRANLMNNSASILESFTSSSQPGRKSMSIVNIGNIPTRLSSSSVKKSDPKYSTIKKIPNFMEIHKKLFTKSESIADAKQRLEQRHKTLTTSKTNKSMKSKMNAKEDIQLPDKSSNGPYNRFGFKIKRKDAANCFINKSNLRSRRNEQQERTRAIIKGVRTNRRFELQMKARNINL